MENRVEDVYVNVSFCEDGCEYNGINLDTYKVICSCTNEETNSTENTTKNKNKFREFIDDLLNNINYKIVVCYQYWLNIKYLKNNSGFYFSIIIFVILQILIFINGCKWYKITLKKLKEDIYNTYSKNINIYSTNKLNNKTNFPSSKRKMLVPKINNNFLSIQHNIDSEISQKISQTPNKNKICGSEYEEINRKTIEMNNIKTPFYNYFYNSRMKIKKKKNGYKNKKKI